MNTTNFKGSPVRLNGNVPQSGEKAPDFKFVTKDLSELSFYEIGPKKKVIIAVPSLDTGICQMETRRFNQELAGKEDVVGVIISKDLPFAMKRFCEAEGIENVTIASDFRGNFVDDYRLRMEEGPLKGLSARVVFVVDENNTIRYTQIVPDITQEPAYESVMEALDNI